MIVKNRIMRQYSTVVIANFASMALALLTNILLTEMISETEYGIYRYVLNIITMLCSLCNMGIYYSTSKLLTDADNAQEKNLYGATILMILTICVIVFLGGMGIYSLVADYIKESNARYFIYALPLIYTILLQRTFMYMLRGSNKIVDIAIQTVLPHVVLVAVYLFIRFVVGKKIGYIGALCIYAIAFGLTHLQTIIRIKASFGNGIPQAIKDIMREQATNGLEIYKGSLMSVLTADVLNVIIGSISATAEYAVYSLALSFSAPILQIPVAMGTIQFKKNASLKKIPSREIVITAVLGLLAYLGLNIVLTFFFPLIYKNRYTGTLTYVMIISFGYLFHGFGDYFNYFLNSHGFGKNIKKAAYLCGLVQIGIAIVLIPCFEIWGVVGARVCSSLTYFLIMLFWYRRSTR